MFRFWKPGWPRKLTVCAVILFLYSVAGFFILPPILKSVIESELNSKLNAKVAIGSISVNPFALSLTIHNFESFDESQNKLLTFDSLYFNLQTRSLIERAPTFSLISLTNPNIRIG